MKKAMLLLLALACAGCTEKERQIGLIRPEAHDIFGPEICSRRKWPFGNVYPARAVYSWSLPGSDVARTCGVGDEFVDSQGRIFTCAEWLPRKESKR